MLAKRKMRVTELAEKVGMTMANTSILKNGKAKGTRFSTLEAICKALECQPETFWSTKRTSRDALARYLALRPILSLEIRRDFSLTQPGALVLMTGEELQLVRAMF